MNDAFENQLTDAVRALSSEDDRPHTLERLVAMAPDFFADCQFAGVSLVEGGTIHTPAATTEALRRLDEQQYVLGQGPCYDAIRRMATVVVDDLATDPRWPTWGRAMAEQLGIRSSLSFRLFTRAESTWGALNLYSLHPHAFTDEDVMHGQTMAAMTAVVLAKSINDEHLARALETRTHIGQAMGILMERYSLDGDRAFEVLRRLSSQSNVKLYDLAAEIVSTRQVPDTSRPLERGRRDEVV